MRVLFIGNSMEGTLKQRCIMPCKYLDNADYAPEINVMSMEAKIYINILGTMRQQIRPFTYYDVIVLQFAWDNDLIFLISRLNKLGIKVVIDLDDDYINENPFYPYDKNKHRDNLQKLIKSISMADLVTVTTDSLAETYGKYNNNIIILPNMIDIEEFDKCSIPCSRVVGWYSSGIRFEEMRSILEGWIPENINLYFAGSKIFENFKHDKKTVIDRYNPDSLPEILSHIDIGLIPLSLNKFNNGKSDLKGLEMGAMGIPFIASPTEPYKKLIKHGVNGFLVKHGRDWSKYIEMLINDDKLRNDMGRAARKVSESRDIKSNAWRWEEVYDEIK